MIGGAQTQRFYVVTKTTRGDVGGRYSSKSGPAAAARKAASRRITVRETGTDREFTYDASRVKLPKPIVRTVGDKVIKTEYSVEVNASR